MGLNWSTALGVLLYADASCVGTHQRARVHGQAADGPRKLSPYQAFFRATFAAEKARLAAEAPGITWGASDIVKVIGHKWKQQSPDEKAQYAGQVVAIKPGESALKPTNATAFAGHCSAPSPTVVLETALSMAPMRVDARALDLGLDSVSAPGDHPISDSPHSSILDAPKIPTPGPVRD